MRRKRCLIYLLIFTLVVYGGLVAYRTMYKSSSFVRKISGLPAGKRDWAVKAYRRMLFVFDFTEELPPFNAVRID
ncbi:MAG: hypothetical protein N2381_11260, partial [Armatimonadetes bacterium]|nr:hypothetical protein [Armatimonadota bacterium]